MTRARTFMLLDGRTHSSSRVCAAIACGLSLSVACTEQDSAGTQTLASADGGAGPLIGSKASTVSAGRKSTAPAKLDPAADGRDSQEQDTTKDSASHASVRHDCTVAYEKDPRDDTMTGELVRIVIGDNDTPDDPSDDPYELLLPQEIQDWLDEVDMVQTHGDWHNVRRWDQSCMRVKLPSGAVCQSAAAMTARGLSRAPIQEGEPGDGLAFLAMHRHMVRGIRQAFPKHANTVLRGFKHVPMNKADPENPIPWVDVKWSDAQVEAIAIMEDISEHLDLFTSEDDYAKWVQFGDGFPGIGGPPPGFDGDLDAGVPAFPGLGGFPPPLGVMNPGTLPPSGPGSDDAGTGDSRNAGGMHGPLHGQWTLPNSPSLLTDNNRNVRNFAFWRLHGWIDDMWTRYREARGLGEDQPEYQALLVEQCEEMHELAKATAIDPESMEAKTYDETGVFAEDVAPIFSAYCAGSQCHAAASPTLGVSLTGAAPSAIRQGLLGETSTEMPALSLIEPGSPEDSWVFRKISGDFSGLDCSTGVCTRMPPAGMGPTADEIETIRSWIADGAKLE